MKKVVFLGKTNGYVTPEQQGNFLRKYGHLEVILKDAMVTSKYYIYEGVGFKVMCVDDKIVQINRMDADEVKRIASCSKVKFGDF